MYKRQQLGNPPVASPQKRKVRVKTRCGCVRVCICRLMTSGACVWVSVCLCACLHINPHTFLTIWCCTKEELRKCKRPAPPFGVHKDGVGGGAARGKNTKHNRWERLRRKNTSGACRTIQQVIRLSIISHNLPSDRSKHQERDVGNPYARKTKPRSYE